MNANDVKAHLYDYLGNSCSPFEYIGNEDIAVKEYFYMHGAIQFASYLVDRCEKEAKEVNEVLLARYAAQAQELSGLSEECARNDDQDVLRNH